MRTEAIAYQHQGHSLEGHFAYDSSNKEKRPLVLVAHAWAGRDKFECQKAEMLAELGYAGFAMDVYGKGIVGTSVEENTKLMNPLMEDRQMLRERLMAGMEVAMAQPQVDPTRVAAIGFCFGGLCVLDMARAGANLSGVVSFHGLLFTTADNIKNERIHAKILALHGHDDPMVPPEQVLAFETEMTTAKADWQVHTYGNTLHAFTNPNANDINMGTVYNATAEHRSLQAMRNFLQEIFA